MSVPLDIRHITRIRLSTHLSLAPERSPQTVFASCDSLYGRIPRQPYNVEDATGEPPHHIRTGPAPRVNCRLSPATGANSRHLAIGHGKYWTP